MNFDIKYATYLQIFNFIKIKQVLGIILGTLDWGHLTKPLNNHGYTLEILNISTDKVGPTHQRQRKEEREHRAA